MRIGRAGLFTVLWAVDLGFREFGLLFGDPTGCVGPAGWWKTEVLCHFHSHRSDLMWAKGVLHLPHETLGVQINIL